MQSERANAREARLQKLRELICHAGTPAAERRAALDRLEALARGEDAPLARTVVTRSARIGRSRRPLPLDELERLEPYALGRSFGEVAAELARACLLSGCRPDRIDLGWHAQEGPVAAVCFASQPMPDLDRFRGAIRLWLPEAKVTLSTFVAEGERRILVFMAPGSGGEPARG
ncbi:MAG: hypothetical protein NZ555_08745 [Geminicoccaceae bacterium]|nr:hypothetical protein [Geminicoccaceae bacterium]MCX8100900.1 hypothetical protein [Geminicoccaceae bacterium]MDW8370600.1 hypothetical protein [Geminicoccaceae bacterium]